MNFIYNGKNILSIVRDLTDSGLAGVALKIAETHPEVFAAALLGECAHNDYGSFGGTPVRLTDKQMIEIGHMSSKVVAIKHLREVFGIGLKEAKDLVEALATHHLVNRKDFAPWTPEAW